jgi:hypothetical protein
MVSETAHLRLVHLMGGNRDAYLILRRFLPMQENGGADRKPA